MQSEEFDSKIKEAADHHHPAYDEKAWINMEKLLDKHLPKEKDDRRKIVFFLLFFFLLGSGVWLFISKPWKENKRLAQAKQIVTQLTPVLKGGDATSDKDKNITKDAINVPDNKGKDKKSTVADIPGPGQYNGIARNVSGKKEQKAVVIIIPATGNKKTNSSQTLSVGDNKMMQDNNNVKSNEQDKNYISPVKTNTNNPITEIGLTNKKNEPATNNNKPAVVSTPFQIVNVPEKQETVNKENAPLVEDTAAKKTKSAAKRNNSFFFTLSAAPDISAAGTKEPGKIKMLAGAGLGYTFKNRFTIRTGFYSGRKIYSASPDDYHPPTDFQTYFPYLEKVNADCKVYEIPLSFSYNFGNSSNHNWFASAGLSSYLMKKETYDYFYKYTPTSPTINSKWVVQDENKHYFSVLTLSAGYRQNINKTASLLIEPYFKMPLSGVGYGKVKLNSAGVLFSVGIKPFNSSKGHNKLHH